MAAHICDPPTLELREANYKFMTRLVDLHNNYQAMLGQHHINLYLK